MGNWHAPEEKNKDRRIQQQEKPSGGRGRSRAAAPRA